MRGSEPRITFTVDLEDPTERYDANGRYVMLARRILELCRECKRRATFFTIGRVAEGAPELIKDIAAEGHEIAFHSHAHVPLTEEDPVRFRWQSREDKDRLEQLAGKKVIGFRVPRFSLTPKSLWAVDMIGELGFRYSSSVMPTGLSLFGFARASREPFLWPNGLIELPLPVTRMTRMPYLGGVYLYMLPMFLAKRAAIHAGSREILWTYTHPYDFDRGEKFAAMPHTPFWVSTVLWAARRKAEAKIRHILALGDAPPLCERLPDLS